MNDLREIWMQWFNSLSGRQLYEHYGPRGRANPTRKAHYSEELMSYPHIREILDERNKKEGL